MQTIAVVGLDLAKNVFQVHGVAADGAVVVRRQLRRGQVLAFFQSIGGVDRLTPPRRKPPAPPPFRQPRLPMRHQHRRGSGEVWVC